MVFQHPEAEQFRDPCHLDFAWKIKLHYQFHLPGVEGFHQILEFPHGILIPGIGRFGRIVVSPLVPPVVQLLIRLCSLGNVGHTGDKILRGILLHCHFCKFIGWLQFQGSDPTLLQIRKFLYDPAESSPAGHS